VNDPATVGLLGGFDPEAYAIREHVAAGLWPEHIAEVPELQKAVALCAFGAGELSVVVGGHPSSAAMLVAALGLEDFVERRQAAALNLN
jgi:hypothetical protein